MVENFAPLYSNLTLPVPAGTYCTHNGVLYRANTTIASGEAWTQGHWTNVDVGGEVSDLKSALNSALFDSVGSVVAVKSSNWTRGGLNTAMNGTNTNTNRARIQSSALPVIPSGNAVFVRVPSGYMIRVAAYSQRSFTSKIAILTEGNDYVEGDVPIPSEYYGTYFGCTLKKSNDSDFSDSDIAALKDAITICITSVIGNLNNLETTDKSTLVSAINETHGVATNAASAAASIVATAIAPVYTEKTYAVGDYCTHNGSMYKCNTAIATAESWTAAHWTPVTTGDELTALNSATNTLEFAFANKINVSVGTIMNGYWGITNSVASLVTGETQYYRAMAVPVEPGVYIVDMYSRNYVGDETNVPSIILGTQIGTSATYNVVQTITYPIEEGKITNYVTVPDNGTDYVMLLTKYGTGDGTVSVQYLDQKIDDTLTLKNYAADAKETGDEIRTVKSLFESTGNPAQFDATHFIAASDGSYSANTRFNGYFGNQNFIDIEGMNYVVYMTSSDYEYRVFYYSNNLQSAYIGKGDYTAGIIKTKLTGTFNNQTYKYVRFNIHKIGSSSNDDFDETVAAFRVDSFTARDFAKKSEVQSLENNMWLQTARCASVAMYETFGVLGGSRESGYIYKQNQNGDPQSYYDLAWGAVLARKNGNTAKIYARQSLTSVSWLTSNYGLSAFEADAPCQLYIMALGTNDANHPDWQELGDATNVHGDGTTFGTQENIDSYTEADLATTYGAYSYILCRLKNKSPNGHIVCLFRYTPDDGTNYTNVWTAIQYIANKYGLPVMNWCDSYTHQRYVYPAEYRYGSHPVAVGYAAMANCFEELYADCVANNWEYFSHYTG